MSSPWVYAARRLLLAVPLLFGEQAACVVGLDLHSDMLRENQIQRDRACGRWGLVQGDMRTLPFPNAWADAVTADDSDGVGTGHESIESSQKIIDGVPARDNFIAMTRSWCPMAMAKTRCTCVCAAGPLVSGGGS